MINRQEFLELFADKEQVVHKGSDPTAINAFADKYKGMLLTDVVAREAKKIKFKYKTASLKSTLDATMKLYGVLMPITGAFWEGMGIGTDGGGKVSFLITFKHRGQGIGGHQNFMSPRAAAVGIHVFSVMRDAGLLTDLEFYNVPDTVTQQLNSYREMQQQIENAH